jgi:hypothetical protein
MKVKKTPAQNTATIRHAPILSNRAQDSIRQADFRGQNQTKKAAQDASIIGKGKLTGLESCTRPAMQPGPSIGDVSPPG